jgi:hypothetical protein
LSWNSELLGPATAPLAETSGGLRQACLLNGRICNG